LETGATGNATVWEGVFSPGANTLLQGGKEYKKSSRSKKIKEADQKEPLRDAMSEGQSSNHEASNQKINTEVKRAHCKKRL
jgi:hypothetical protein